MNIMITLSTVCIILLNLKFLHSANLKTQNNYDITAKYYDALAKIDRSPLSELNMFITALPKGGDLHHHYSGSIYVETFLNWVANKGYCIYRQTDESLNVKQFTIETRGTALPDPLKLLCITAEETRRDNDFYRQLMKRWSDVDYVNHFHEQPPPDKQFFDTFGFFGPVSNADFQEGLTWIKNTAINENVQYIETMLSGGPNLNVAATLIASIDRLSSSSTDSVIENTLNTYWNAVIDNSTINTTINNYVTMIDNLGQIINDANFTLRFQAYATRGNSPSRVFSGLVSSFLAVNRSKYIVGVNIVGPENGIVAIRDYTLHMKMFRFLKNKIPSVKISMHAGEIVLGMVPPEALQFHIREAIEVAGANRIGHGIDIFYEKKSYELLQIMKERNITVEVILTSNEFILGVKNNAHPMLIYEANGVPLVIATDDAGVSRTTLSHEYLMYADRYNPTYSGLKKLVYNSIRFSFLSDEDKALHTQILDNRFQDFEAMIVDVVSKFGTPDDRTSKAFTNGSLSFTTLMIYSLICVFKTIFH